MFTSALTIILLIFFIQLTSALSNGNTTAYSCKVNMFQSGSIIAIYAIIVDADTAVTEEEILTAIQSGLLSNPDFGVDNSSFVLVGRCPDYNDCVYVTHYNKRYILSAKFILR